ncbi:hypothetical protein [Jatrophihabitans sp.]|uniref:hypothetical protein n=1 Tax=Jatrophihabitans sp. TaxID=1932789 RepID=UPI0030C6C5A2|nr:hypothetical protein [Jatrophihabitans sp.]
MKGDTVRIRTGMLGGRVGVVSNFSGPGLIWVDVQVPVSSLFEPDGPTKLVTLPYSHDELEAVR